MVSVKAGPPVKQTLSMGNQSVRLSHKPRPRTSSGDFAEFDDSKFERTRSRSRPTSSRKSTRSSHFGDNMVPENQNPAFYEKPDGTRAPANHVNPDTVPALPKSRSRSS